MTVRDKSIPEVTLVSVDQMSTQLLGEVYVSGYLMNRNRLGIPLRRCLMGHLTEMEERGALAVDFSGIREMTTSIAEEIGPNLFEEFLAHRMQDRNVYLTYCNVSGEIAGGLDGAFLSWQPHLDSSKRFTVVAFGKRQDSRFAEHQFLGEVVPDALREALDQVYRLGQANSSDLEALGIKAASRKLNELFKQYPWLLRRSQKSLEVGPRAWAYFYSPVVPVFDAQE